MDKEFNSEKIELMRKTIREQLTVDSKTYEKMNELMKQQLPLLSRIGEHYAKVEKGIKIRPTFGNEMQILYMRDRQTFMFVLFPELKELCYQVGKVIGQTFIAPNLTGTDLPSIMLSNVHFATEHKYAYQEIIEISENHAVYRSYECADCYGLPNIGQKICIYEAGTAAGAFEAALGKPVEVTEIKCCANGDRYCEFEVKVRD